MAIAVGNNTIIWDFSTNAIIEEIEYTDTVQSVAFSPDGQMVASGLWDGDIVFSPCD